MRKISGLLLALGVLMAGDLPGIAQVTAGSQVAGREAAGDHGSIKPGVAGADSRTEKQRMLAQQTEQLFNMATELKAQVDLTNKNILSLKVVQKAGEIESLAKGMRGQAKKQ